MTENTTPTPPLTPVRPPLRRSRTDRVLGGVAGGFARWLGIDPTIVRVVLVILAVFGGSGLVLYAIGWLFIPDEGDPSSEAEKLAGRFTKPSDGSRTAMIVVGVVVGVILISLLASAAPWYGPWSFGGGSFLLLLAAGGIVLYLMNRGDGPVGAVVATGPSTTGASSSPHSDDLPTMSTQAPGSASAPASAPAAGTAPTSPTALPAGFAYGGAGGYPGYVPPTAPPPPPPAPRERSYLGAVTLSVALLVMGVLASLNVSGIADIPPVVTLATGLGVLGVGLLVGAFLGRARWLIAIAVPLLLIVSLVAVFPTNLRLNPGIGERTWTPVTAAEAAGPYQLGIGGAELDLTDMTLPADADAVIPVQASVGVGELRVIVPEGVEVTVVGTVGLGEIDIEGLPRVSGQNPAVDTDMPGSVDPLLPTIELTADVSIGKLEVSRA